MDIFSTVAATAASTAAAFARMSFARKMGCPAAALALVDSAAEMATLGAGMAEVEVSLETDRDVIAAIVL